MAEFQPQPGMISGGAIRELFSGPGVIDYAPILQVLTLKAVQKDDGPPMYRLVLSDGENWVQGLLANELAHMIDEPRPAGNGATGDNTKIHRGSVIKATTIKASNLQKNQRKFLIVSAFEVVSSASWERIGTPVPFVDGAKPDSQADQPAQPGAPAPAPAPAPAKAQAPPPNAAPAPPPQNNASNLSSSGFYGQQQSNNNPNKPNQFGQANTAGAGVPPAAPGRAPAYMPVAEVTPFQHRWSIRATCSRKFDIKTWNKPNSSGKLFSVNLMDESGEIRATGFNAECDKLYDLFEEGVVYYISTPCSVKNSNKRFSNLKHDYELTFERDTRVEKAEDQSNAPQVHLDFTTIGDLPNVEKETVINLIGILKDVGEESEIVSKTTNRPFSKRELTIVDDTLHSVRLTVWGNTAQTFSVPVDSVIAFKGAKVSDFGGRSLSLLSSGSMMLNPDIDQAHRLKGWFESQGKSGQFSGFSNSEGGNRGGGEILTIKRVKDTGLGASEEPAYFNVKATVAFFSKDTFAYPACSSSDCNRKVTPTPDEAWRCEKCNKEYPKPVYRYILTLNISDHTNQLWVSCFDEAGRTVMGVSADELTNLKETDDNGFLKVVDKAMFRTFMFRCRARQEIYQDQPKMRYQVLSAVPINPTTEGHRLGGLIERYEKMRLERDGDKNGSLFVK